MSADPEGTGRDERRRRSRRGPGRFLAPLALLIVIIAVLVIVSESGGGSSSSGSPAVGSSTTVAGRVSGTSTTSRTSTGPEKSRTTETTTTGAAGAAGAGTGGTYTIASGDTFSVIAAKTGVSLATLEALNPGASPSSLTVGEVIKLR